MNDRQAMSDPVRLAWLRYVDPEPPDFPRNRAWDFWKLRDDERKRLISADNRKARA